MKEQKPIVVHFHENEWEFVFPPSIDNEQTYNQYWEGVELLDYDDLAAERIFKAVIKKCPYHIDAYNHLSIAFKNQKKPYESFLTADKAYLIGKSCLPKEFKQSHTLMIVFIIAKYFRIELYRLLVLFSVLIFHSQYMTRP